MKSILLGENSARTVGKRTWKSEVGRFYLKFDGIYSGGYNAAFIRASLFFRFFVSEWFALGVD